MNKSIQKGGLLFLTVFTYLTALHTQAQTTIKDTIPIFNIKSEADSLYKIRNYKKAAKLYAKSGNGYLSAKVWRRAALCYNTEANCYLSTREYSKAYQRLVESLKILKENVGVLTYEEGQAYDILSYYYELDLSDFEKSEAYLEKSIEVFRQLPNEELALVRGYNNMVYISNIKGNYRKALEYSKKGLELMEEKQIDNDLQKANLYGNMGNAHNKLGNYEEALHSLEKGTEIHIKIFGEEHPRVAADYQNLGALYQNISNYKKAIAYSEKALTVGLSVFGEKDPFIGKLYINISNGYRKINQYGKALEYAEKSLSLLEEIHGKDHFNAEVTLKNLSIIHHELRDDAKAIEYALRALEVNKRVLGENNEKVASSYDYLGGYYGALGQFDRAISYYQKALDIYEKKYPKGHFRISGIYEGLALDYDDMGKDSLAIVYWTKSLKMNEELFPKGNPRRIARQIAVGKSYLRRKEFVKAQELFDKAQEELNNPIFEGIGKQGNETGYVYSEYYLELFTLSAKNNMQRYLQNNDKNLFHSAQQQYRKADSIIDDMRKYHNQYGDKILYARANQKVYHEALKASLSEDNKDDSTIRNAFYYAEKGKSNILKELLKEGEASSFAGLPNTILESERNLKNKRAFYSSKIANASKGAERERNKYRDKLFKVNLSYDSLIKVLQKDYPNYFSFKYDNNVMDIQEIQDKLPKKTSLLEYVLHDSIAYTFLVSKNTFKVKQLTIKGLRKRIESYKTAIEKKNLIQFKETSHDLYTMLMEPFATELEGEELVIVPDGLLWNLNFELLLTQKDPSNNPRELSYLLKEYAISYGNSASVLFGTSREGAKIIPECLAFSFSDSSKKGTGNILRLENLRGLESDLPGTRAEIKEIAKIMDGAYYYGSEAVESKFKEEADKYAILHLALHGEVDHENPDNSKLYFTQRKDTLDDNFLYSHEIFALNLPAELAVLSACNTGYGKVTSGEGVMSLGNTFQYAGTKSLLLSSWEVSDLVAPELMKLFYQNLKKGLSKSKALQEAKLDYLNTAPSSRIDPFYWGSFYVLGSNGPIVFENNNWLIYSILIIVALTLIVLMLYKRNKANT